MFYREHVHVYPLPQLTDMWQSQGHNLHHNLRICFGKPAWEERHILNAQNGLPYLENSTIFSYHGLASLDNARIFLSPYVWIQSFLPQGELPTKADDSILPVVFLLEFPSPSWAAGQW